MPKANLFSSYTLMGTIGAKWRVNENDNVKITCKKKIKIKCQNYPKIAKQQKLILQKRL